MLDDKFEAGLIGLVSDRLTCSHSFHCVRAWSAIAVLLSVQFLKNNIPQSSVATLFRCGGTCNNSYCKFPAECNGEKF